ncbi:MAG: stage II sporulation protein D [Bacilli bacterium]
MKNKILIIIILILSFVAVKSSQKEILTTFSNEPELKKEEKVITVSLLDTKTNEKKILNLEDYIVGVVSAEMPASFSDDALKAQAIAARTYAMYKVNTSTTDYDLVTDVSNQAFITEDKMRIKWGSEFDTYYKKIKDAVNETKSLIMKYDNTPICAFYFAMSNGYTEDAALVFGSDLNYLHSVDSTLEKSINNFEVNKEFTKVNFCKLLDITCENILITNVTRSKTDRVNNITVNNKTFTGTTFRKLLGLRSTDFRIDIDNVITITTKGYGHGVGMSQYGANEMSKNGKTYQDILNHYYKDIEISKI